MKEIEEESLFEHLSNIMEGGFITFYDLHKDKEYTLNSIDYKLNEQYNKIEKNIMEGKPNKLYLNDPDYKEQLFKELNKEQLNILYEAVKEFFKNTNYKQIGKVSNKEIFLPHYESGIGIGEYEGDFMVEGKVNPDNLYEFNKISKNKIIASYDRGNYTILSIMAKEN